MTNTHYTIYIHASDIFNKHHSFAYNSDATDNFNDNDSNPEIFYSRDSAEGAFNWLKNKDLFKIFEKWDNLKMTIVQTTYDENSCEDKEIETFVFNNQ